MKYRIIIDYYGELTVQYRPFWWPLWSGNQKFYNSDQAKAYIQTKKREK